MARFSQFQSNRKQNENVSEADIRQKYDSYKNMSKEQLNENLLREVARQKSNGSFDYNTLEAMVGSLQGMLPPADYENIKRILESLK
ncbi:MAG: hypothetical protein J6A28_01555 [Clostridia bacterium]|nr:hypothetical protein [Clostridia bacterium]